MHTPTIVAFISTAAEHSYAKVLITLSSVAPLERIHNVLQASITSLKLWYDEGIFQRIVASSCRTASVASLLFLSLCGARYHLRHCASNMLNGQKIKLDEIEERIAAIKEVHANPVPVMGVLKVFNTSPLDVVPLMERHLRLCYVRAEDLQEQLNRTVGRGYLWGEPAEVWEGIKELRAAVRRLDEDAQYESPAELQARLEKAQVLINILQEEEEERNALYPDSGPTPEVFEPWDENAEWFRDEYFRMNYRRDLMSKESRQR